MTTERTEKVTPLPEESSRVEDLAQSTGGGLAQLTGEVRIRTTSREYDLDEGSWLSVRSEGGASWLCVWNKSYDGKAPNLKIRL